MSLVIIGTVAYDDIETPEGSAENILAGSATYLSLSAALLVKHPKIISVVGGDFHQDDLNIFRERGIDTEGLEVVLTGKTFRWKGRYHTDMNVRDTIYTHLNVVEDFRPKLPPSYFPVKFLSLGNMDPDLQLEVMRQARAEFVVGDTMNLWIEIKTDSVKEVIANVDCFILNDSEAVQLTGKSNLFAAAKCIQSFGCRTVIVKKGEHGAILLSGDKIFVVPAFPLDSIKDPTGAGDSFAGGFIGYLASQGSASLENIKQASLYGIVIASFCIQDFGTVSLQAISPRDVSRRLSEFKQMISL